MLSSTAIIFDGANSGRTISMNGAAGTVTWASSVTLSSAGTLTGSNNTLGNASGAMTLVNDGLISWGFASQGLTINATSFTNNGTVQANVGAISINSANWTNSGLLTVSSGGTLNLGGNLTTAGLGALEGAAGGTINITGIITNTGQTLAVNAGTGSLNILGGTIVDGTVSISGGARLLATTTGGTIDGATINGEVTTPTNSSRLLLSGTVAISRVTMSGANANLRFADGAVFSAGTISIEGAAGGQRNITMNGAAGSLTLGAGAVIETVAGIGASTITIGSAAGAMTLVNNGAIRSNAPGRPLVVNPAGVFTNAGTVDVGPGALLTVAAEYTQTASGTFRARISGLTTAGYGRMTVTGAANLDGTFEVQEAGGFHFMCFNSIDFITATTLNGTFATVNLPAPTSFVYQPKLLYVNGNTVRVYIDHIADFNRDGSLDPDDLADFISAFFAQPPGDGADFNGDGVADPDDLADFITAYFIGCP